MLDPLNCLACKFFTTVYSSSDLVGSISSKQGKTRAEDTRVSRTPDRTLWTQKEDDTGMFMETESGMETSPKVNNTKLAATETQQKIVECSLKQTIPGLASPPKGKTKKTTSRNLPPVQHSPPLAKSQNLGGSFGS
jgi:hypothetical protein